MFPDSFVRNDQGGVSTIFAMSLLALCMVSGLALVASDLNWSSTATQRALDSAVLAAAIPTDISNEERILIAEQAYLANQIIDPADDAQVKLAKSAPGRFGTTETTVYGTAVVERRSPFINLFGVSHLDVTVTAAATKADSAPICVLGLDPTEEATLDFNGRASVDAINCAAMANSASGAGMRQVGSASMKAKEIAVTGGYEGSNFDPQPQIGIEPVHDPLAGVPEPAAGSCDPLSGSRITNQVLTLSPGTYCGGLHLQSGSQVTLLPGVYIMKDGPLYVQAGAIVTGNEVMIAFLGETSTLYMYADASMTLTSPVSGPFANIQFFGDRNVHGRKLENLWFTVIGGSLLRYDGVAYLPSFHLWVAGSSQIIGLSPTYTAIAKKLWFQDNSKTVFENVNSRGLDIPAAEHIEKTAHLIR